MALASVKFAEESPEPPLEELYDYTFVEPRPARPGKGAAKPRPARGRAGSIESCCEVMREITYRQALNEALAEEMERDPDVFLMGEEVAEYNGAYKVSQGLLERFGAEPNHRHADQ